MSRLVSGDNHIVDSNELAFMLAAAGAIRQGKLDFCDQSNAIRSRLSLHSTRARAMATDRTCDVGRNQRTDGVPEQRALTSNQTIRHCLRHRTTRRLVYDDG